MAKLVKNGEIILDGTQSKAEKEKKILTKWERVEDFMINHDLKTLTDYEKRVIAWEIVRHKKVDVYHDVYEENSYLEYQIHNFKHLLEQYRLTVDEWNLLSELVGYYADEEDLL